MASGRVAEWPSGDDDLVQGRLQSLKNNLAKIFLGVFMHDYGLW
jgi:hypothetical protein